MCGGFDGTLHVDEARVRAITCTKCGEELEVVDTWEDHPDAVRNVGVIGHPGAAEGLDIPAAVEVIVIKSGMDSFVCCPYCRVYYDSRFPCTGCGRSL